jgi:hypothetical protein
MLMMFEGFDYLFVLVDTKHGLKIGNNNYARKIFVLMESISSTRIPIFLLYRLWQEMLWESFQTVFAVLVTYQGC